MHVGKKFTTEIKSKCVNWLQAKKTNIFTCKANIFTCKANMLTYKTNIFRKVKVYDRNKEQVFKLVANLQNKYVHLLRKYGHLQSKYVNLQNKYFHEGKKFMTEINWLQACKANIFTWEARTGPFTFFVFNNLRVGEFSW